jgi:hypothetical protein
LNHNIISVWDSNLMPLKEEPITYFNTLEPEINLKCSLNLTENAVHYLYRLQSVSVVYCQNRTEHKITPCVGL